MWWILKEVDLKISQANQGVIVQLCVIAKEGSTSLRFTYGLLKGGRLDVTLHGRGAEQFCLIACDAYMEPRCVGARK